MGCDFAGPLQPADSTDFAVPDLLQTPITISPSVHPGEIFCDALLSTNKGHEPGWRAQLYVGRQLSCEPRSAPSKPSAGGRRGVPTGSGHCGQNGRTPLVSATARLTSCHRRIAYHVMANLVHVTGVVCVSACIMIMLTFALHMI